MARVVAAVLLLLAVACGGEPPAPRQADDAGTLPDRDAPALPDCPDVGTGEQAPPGLSLPPGAVVLESSVDGPLTSTRGFVPLDPVAVHAFYDGSTDLELVTLEEEGFEAEVVYGDAQRRVYVKARIACEGGSTFTAIVGERGAAVPTPTGSPVPATQR